VAARRPRLAIAEEIALSRPDTNKALTITFMATQHSLKSRLCSTLQWCHRTCRDQERTRRSSGAQQQDRQRSAAALQPVDQEASWLVTVRMAW
jgi:hypothetical protein